jgi:WD40 repeat protein
MVRWGSIVAVAFFACAGERPPPAVQPVTGPEPLIETKPPTTPTEAAPPPVCEEDTSRVFSPDGKHLALTHGAGGIQIYDTSTWTLVASLVTRKIAGMFFAGRRFVFAEGVAGKEDLYRVQVLDESFRSIFEVSNALTGWQGAELATSDDGGQLLLPVLDETRTPDNPEHVLTRVELWDVVARKKLFEHALAEDDGVPKLVIGKQGHVLVGAARLSLFPKGSKKAVKSWEYRPDPEPSFSHDGAFVSFRKESVLHVYGIGDKKLRTLKDKDCDGQGAVWSADGKTLAAGGFSFHVCLFDPKSGRLRQTLPNPRVPTQTFEDEGMREPVEWSRDGRTLVTKGLFELIAFDAKTGRHHDIAQLRGPQSAGLTSWNQNDSRMQTRARDGALLVLHQGRLQAHVLGGRLVGDVLDGEAFTQLAVSQDGERFLRVVEGLEIVSTSKHPSIVPLEGTAADKDAYGDGAFWFDPLGKYVISGSGPLRVWSAETGKRTGPKRDERCPER